MKNSNRTAFAIIFFVILGYFAIRYVAPNIENFGDLVDLINPAKISSDDVSLDSEQGLTSLYVILLSDYDLDWIEIKLELMDSNDRIIGTETKRFTDISANEQYKFEYSMSISEILSAKKYRFVFVEGKRA